MENQAKCIPYIAHEATIASKDRTIKRLIATIITTCIISNAAWIYAYIKKG